MPAFSSFEYAIIRVVPRVEREEFVNAGAVLFARTARYLEALIALDCERLAAMARELDLEEVQRNLAVIAGICQGDVSAGPIATLPQAERFRWLVAPRSTVVQPSPVHCGLCADPRAMLEHLLATMVLSPASG